MTLARNNASKHEGRRNNMGADASMEKRLSTEVLKERYKAAVRFTTGVVFGHAELKVWITGGFGAKVGEGGCG